MRSRLHQRTAAGGGLLRWARLGQIVAGIAILIVALVLWVPTLSRVVAGRGGAGPVVHFMLAVAVVVLICHSLGALFRILRQPPVVGEILGGLLLGPSALGALWPVGKAWLFTPFVLGAMNVAAQLGLIVFLFLLGCELRGEMLRGRGRTVGLVAAGAMAVPFFSGLGIAVPFQASLHGTAGGTAGYLLFVGLAVSITALPVLARILVDGGLMETRLGILALTCAGIDDAIAWTVLAFVLALTAAAGTGGAVATLGLTLTIALVAVLCVRPLLADIIGWAERRPNPERLVLPVLLTGAFGFAIATQAIGLDAIIGAFLFGVITPRRSATVRQIGARLEGFTVVILLPLFFAGIGLNTMVGLLGSSAGHWLIFAVVLMVATASKFVGATGAARLSGVSPRESLCLGALMNCRGITELVIANVGLQNHLINTFAFTILVLIALISTAMTGLLVRLFARGTLLATPTTVEGASATDLAPTGPLTSGGAP